MHLFIKGFLYAFSLAAGSLDISGVCKGGSREEELGLQQLGYIL